MKGWNLVNILLGALTAVILGLYFNIHFYNWEWWLVLFVLSIVIAVVEFTLDRYYERSKHEM